MKRKTSRSTWGPFLLGAAVGAAAIIIRNTRAQKHPDQRPEQVRVSKALDRALYQARKQTPLPLDADHRYIIFSDHHKGARNLADDFQACEKTYLRALDFYFDQDYSLIILGDAEELWEEKAPSVMNAYPTVFESEARFYPGRYFRIVGNHDNNWEIPANIQTYLHPYFPDIPLYHSLVMSYQGVREAAWEVFLAHGHQGTLDADVFDFIPPLVLPLYRELQNLTGLGRTCPSEDACLRADHDTLLYRWASKQPKLILIAGHTHRPVWGSVTHLEKLISQLQAMQATSPADRPPDFAEQVARLKSEIEERQLKYPPCTDTLKIKPSYFNTGCCRFEDGDITGIELDGDRIRMVKWGAQAGVIMRSELETTHLASLFVAL